MDEIGGTLLGNVAGFIAGAQAEGQSASGALAGFRDLGGSMRTQTWYRAWGEVEASGAAAGPTSALAPDSVPTISDYSPWAAGTEGKLMHQVTLFYRDRNGDVMSTEWSISSSSPLATSDVIAEAAGEFEVATRAGGTGEGQTLIGGLVSGLYRMTGGGR